MVRLSGFGDEISADLDEQLDVLRAEGIGYLELRGAWKKNVTKFTAAEVRLVSDALARREMRVSCIASPAGKAPIQDDFGPQMDVFKRAIEAALSLRAPYVRMFSFYMPEKEDPARFRDEVLARMQAMVDEVKDTGLILLSENEKGLYGENAVRCADVLESISSPRLRALFDPANFVQVGLRPYSDCFELLRQHIEYYHVKDALFYDGSVVPAGEGDGEFPQIVQAIAASGFSGFLSLEPHLVFAGAASGFSGSELFSKAVKALRGLLDRAGVHCEG
ncbi:MAG: sugar phosphate isomerase/epimerase [Firmicutes bacterium]|nr:sugar phosphate isomerase/epimerase [Bacillota bacterium]